MNCYDYCSICFNVIGSQKVESYANHFEVRNPAGHILFYAGKDEVHLGAEKLSVGGGCLLSDDIRGLPKSS